jgi:integrating conjugative element protein (TIGR03765 family)
MRAFPRLGPPRLVCAALTALALSVARPAAATLDVVFDGGPTRALAPYLTLLRGAVDPVTPRAVPAVPGPWWPVRTPELSPRTTIESPSPAITARLRLLPRPLFVLGADAASRDWLARRAPALRALDAVGLLVQVETPDELAAVRQLGAGLWIVPVPGSQLAAVWGLRHYPLVLTRAGFAR